MRCIVVLVLTSVSFAFRVSEGDELQVLTEVNAHDQMGDKEIATQSELDEHEVLTEEDVHDQIGKKDMSTSAHKLDVLYQMGTAQLPDACREVCPESVRAYEDYVSSASRGGADRSAACRAMGGQQCLAGHSECGDSSLYPGQSMGDQDYCRGHSTRQLDSSRRRRTDQPPPPAPAPAPPTPNGSSAFRAQSFAGQVLILGIGLVL